MTLSVDGKVQILNGATSAVASASYSMDGGGKETLEAFGTTSSGSGAAVIEIQVSNDNSTWQTAGTINLNLRPTQTSDKFTMDASWLNWLYVRAKLASISGTGASVSVYKITGAGNAGTAQVLGTPTISANTKGPITLFGGPSMDIADITIVSGSPTLSVETDSFGRKRLKVVTGSGTAAQISFSGLVNAYFGGDAYVSLQGSYEDGLQSMTMYFAPGATVATNYVLSGAINFASAITNPYMQPGAGNYPFTWRTGKKNNSITGSITYPFIAGSHKLVITPRASTVATVYIYAVGVGAKNKKGRCFVISDDGMRSWFSIGNPLFNEVGIPTTASIAPVVIGTTALYAGLHQLADYVDGGNVIVSHGPNVGSFSGNLISNHSTNVDRLADMNVSRDYISDNGLYTPNSDQVYIWPQGEYQTTSGDVTLLDLAYADGFRIGRCSDLINATVQYNADAASKYQRMALPYSTHGWAGSTASQVANVTALTTAISNAATYGTDIFVTFHDVVIDSTADGSMNATKCRVTDLITIRDAMVTAMDAGTLECLPLTSLAKLDRDGLFS